MTRQTTYESIESTEISSKLGDGSSPRINLVETCLLTKWWTVQRWHDLNIGVYMKHGNLRANVKGVYQVCKDIR